ncbi:MAG: hypothetical protein Q9180_006237, partial [Flavoplaca navasiana]
MSPIDKYGLAGLLANVRSPDADTAALAIGQDLTQLGMDLNSPEYVFPPSLNQPIHPPQSTTNPPSQQADPSTTPSPAPSAPLPPSPTNQPTRSQTATP